MTAAKASPGWTLSSLIWRGPGGISGACRFWKPARRAEITSQQPTVSTARSPLRFRLLRRGLWAVVPVLALLKAAPALASRPADTASTSNGSARPLNHFSRLHLSQLTPTSAASINDPLVNLINGSRAAKGSAPLQLLPVALVAANVAYAQSVLRQLIVTKTCDHNLPAWQAFQASSTGSRLRPMSEVLGCPEARGSWNPERLLSRWLGSPLHNDILLNRPRNSHAACVQLSEAGRIGVLCSFWVAQ